MKFFNCSMPRSCSTLFQNVLNQNPEIYATPTDGSLELLYGARSNLTVDEFKAMDQDVKIKAWRSFCRAGLNGYCDALTNKPNICIKSRGIGIHYQWYANFLDEPLRIICFVRNIKNILASLEKIFRAAKESPNYIEDHSQMIGTSTQKRCEYWLKTAPVGLAMERFHQMLLEGSLEKCLVIKAEDFTANPKQSMAEVYHYLGMPYYQHNFSNISQVTVEDDSCYNLGVKLHDIKKSILPLQDDSLSILGPNTCQWVDQVCYQYQNLFGYL